MAQQSTASHTAVIQGFRTKLKECTVRAACGRSYVRTAKLTEWLKEKVEPDSDNTHASRLLVATYHNRIKDFLPISSEELCAGEHCCLLVFSILLDLGLGCLVNRFQRQAIEDRHLPIDLLSLQSKLAAMDLASLNLPIPENLAERFDEMQWRFCAARLDFRVGRDHPKNTIIPIFKKEKINDKGGTARLWQIAVQEEFVGHQMRKAVSSSRFYDPKDDFGWGYYFALKTFKEGNRDLYLNERDAFIGLKNHDGMVRYLTEYGHKEIQRAPGGSGTVEPGSVQNVTKTTYNILLEYGDCDLDEYFAERLPPVLDTEVEAFWQDLFEIADAVEGIHNLEVCTDGMRQKFYGWHADIKPDNVLSVQGKFKLADPGFVKFVKKTDKLPPMEKIMGGTETYGAPECYPGKNGTSIAVPQTIDIWSLGCVFSIAATWVALGYPGIRQFVKVRQTAINRLSSKEHSRLGDTFHDSRKVLPDVTSWHSLLRSALRKTDTITDRVLDLVDGKMLLGDSRQRSKAEDICKDLKQILSENRAKPKRPIPENIMKALLEVDEEAPSKGAGMMSSQVSTSRRESLTIPQDRKARKSKLLDQPLRKTTHRSERLKSALSARSAEPEIKPSLYATPTKETDSVQRQASGVPDPFLQEKIVIRQDSEDTPFVQHRKSGHVHSFTPISPTSTRPKLTAMSRRSTFQNVFQARQEVERREKHNYLRKTRKDQLLSKHFGNRDIKFLVDNGETMKDFWYEATYLLETLVWKATGQDENGMDLFFTAGPVKVENKKDKSEFLKAMRDPRAQPMENMHTNIRVSLGNIFAKYLEELENRNKYPYRKEVKDLALIIFTDGVWAGVQNKDDVNQQIVSFVKKLGSTVSNLKIRPVGIEFIQFGNDPDAAYMLRHLDKDLKWAGIPDIIDTEPSSGDVNKMLLGSFVEEYDEDNDEDYGGPMTASTDVSSEWLRPVGSPARTSSFQTIPLSEQAPETRTPTINPPIPPSRQTTLNWRHPSP